MRFMLPILVVAFFTGMTSLRLYQSTVNTPSSKELYATQASEMFVAYAGAVSAFMNSNPSFTGSVSGAQLAAQGAIFSASFLSTAGNTVTAFGTAGRTVTTYATLPTGALGTLATLTEGDASYGTATGATWTSIAAGATPQPLATSVPNGYTVSVIQINQ
ncbi:hypothetical protein [Acidovorax carolinensis]|uniref:hypothetical protein n=1 Tax=Acidovorax carolinensis TaxID=553814 RepID=UPI0012FF85F3|nr:hypothetical protein [Acidovorax carolinensis]